MENIVEIKINKKEILLQEYESLTELFFDLISNVSKNVCENKTILEQYISVDQGSLIIKSNLKAIKPENLSYSEKTINAIKNGIKEIANNPVKPKYFDDNVINILYKLSQNEDISLKANNNEILLNKTFKDNIVKLIPETYTDISAIDGIVIGINLIKNDDIKIRIKERLRGIYVNCSFINKQLEEQAKFLIGKRVYVSGFVKYTSKNLPISIKVNKLEEIKVIDLPRWQDMRGILSE